MACGTLAVWYPYGKPSNGENLYVHTFIYDFIYLLGYYKFAI